jgi:transcriptional regulator with XRE-family HTH domain
MLPCINHIDCDTTNNIPSNLEWCTQAENLAHSRALGRMQENFWRGKRSPNAKLSDEIVQQIRSQYNAGGVSWAELGKRFGMSKRAIGRILRGETYV